MKEELALEIKNLSKQYRLGVTGTGTMSHDFNRWWHKVRGKEDPYAMVGDENDRTVVGGDYVWALKDINLEVKQGEILGIIGKNGAGKSTLLKLLSKISGPTTGSIEMRGRMAALLEVGTGFHPELTGRENIFLNGAILGMSKKEIRDKLDDIVDFSGCAKYVDTPVKRYSSGMRVRLGFAVAAFLEPDILVVDEVLAVGDAEFQKQAIGKMKDVSSKGGRTVLFVSHNMGSIRSLCTRSVVLDKGQVSFSGATEDAISFYLNNQNDRTGVKLTERTDRIGNGKLKFTDVKVINNNGASVTEIISGDSLKVVLSYTKNSEIDVKRLLIGITFWDKYEHKILGFSTDEMGVRFEKLSENGEIILEIPSFAIRGGLYDIKLIASEGGSQMENMLDNIPNTFSLTVLPGDLWKVGKSNREGTMAMLNGTFYHA